MCAALSIGIATAPAHAEDQKERRELRGIPILGGNSDIGLVLGALGQVVWTGEGCYQYCTKLQVQALASFHIVDGLDVPFQNHFVKWEERDVFKDFDLDVGFDFEAQGNIGYFGLGNGSRGAEGNGKRYNQYKRIYPGAHVGSRYHFAEHLSVFNSIDFRYNWMEVYEGSKLAEDLAASADGSGPHVTGGGDHMNTQLSVGLRFENTPRDIDPELGWEWDTQVRAGPDALVGNSNGYVGVNAAVRTFVPIFMTKRRVILALRVVGDGLFGDPPIYELSRFGGFDGGVGIGGGDAVRGVPNGRYHGRWKIFGNAELRTRITRFEMFKQKLVLGTTLFADAGRVWFRLPPEGALENPGMAVKFGLGGGVTVKWGRHFLMRLETAWSPDANPVGVYFNVGDSF